MKNNTRPAVQCRNQAGGGAPACPQLTLSRPLVIAFILAIILPWFLVGWIFFSVMQEGARFFSREAFPSTQTPSILTKREGIGAMNPSSARVVHGPWGILLIDRVIVEPPSAFFSVDYDVSLSRRWIISNATPDQARELLAKAGISIRVVDAVMKTTTPDPAGKGQTLAPPDKIVRELSPAVRAALYSELGKNPANPHMAQPFKFRGSTVHEWFANNKLPDDIIKKIEPLVYHRGPMLCFSDLHLVLPEIASPFDRIRLLRILHRAMTYSLRLNIREGEPIDAMLAYWGSGNRAGAIEPVLESMNSQPGKTELDVVYLLPDFARTRLYTYVNPTRGNTSVSRDCHWTSFNFFNEVPEDRFGRGTDLTDLLTEYKQIPSPAEFGDIILFVNLKKELIHSCVYIADDIVFTKNGVGFGTPFIFERMQHVIDAFRQDAGDFTMKYCRRRASND